VELGAEVASDVKLAVGVAAKVDVGVGVSGTIVFVGLV
jgi:hypothetical protein